MLLCKCCNYYKSFDSSVIPLGGNRTVGRRGGICGYTGVVFSDDPENLDMEYPCYSISFPDIVINGTN